MTDFNRRDAFGLALAGGAALIQDGISFSADQYFTGGATFIDSTGGNGLQSVFTNTVYQTERYGNFSYAIPVASTSQAYTVELRFGELWWSNPGQRVFDVSLEGQIVLNDLDILAQTGSFNTPYSYVSGPITASTAARSSNGTWSKPGRNGPKPPRASGSVEKDTIPSVRPWKFSAQTMISAWPSGTPLTS